MLGLGIEGVVELLPSRHSGDVLSAHWLLSPLDHCGCRPDIRHSSAHREANSVTYAFYACKFMFGFRSSLEIF
jgi:hypothetical protein